jgi:hypothetical protein
MVAIGFLMLAAVVFTAFYPAAAGAHAPGSVALGYDLSSQTLQATITHTRFSDSHYIDKVEVKKNGNLVSLQAYKSQPTEAVVYSYKVTAVAGDVLEVKAYCNKFGSRTQKITVSAPGNPEAK